VSNREGIWFPGKDRVMEETPSFRFGPWDCREHSMDPIERFLRGCPNGVTNASPEELEQHLTALRKGRRAGCYDTGLTVVISAPDSGRIVGVAWLEMHPESPLRALGLEGGCYQQRGLTGGDLIRQLLDYAYHFAWDRVEAQMGLARSLGGALNRLTAKGQP